MTYPWMMTAIADQHQRELFEGARRRHLVRAARAARVARPQGPRLRERVGWRLVDLGIHLVMHPDPLVPPTRVEPARARPFEPVT